MGRIPDQGSGLFCFSFRLLGLVMAEFEVVGDIERVERIAQGRGVRDRVRLTEEYGGNNINQWFKRKGLANIRLSSGDEIRAEVHWYEANGIGKVEMKIKNVLYPLD